MGEATPEFCISDRAACGGHCMSGVRPWYIQHLGRRHDWVFGAIAELIDNASDAKARRLGIKIEYLHLKETKCETPVLSVVDDGHGMSSVGLLKMFTVGASDREDSSRIGEFGVGFMAGTMRLGKDAMVLTQDRDSRSIALFSQTYNENKQNLEIPMVTWSKERMEVDIQSEEEDRIKVIAEVLPFDRHFIDQKFEMFDRKKTGTQIYIWNLDTRGSNSRLDLRSKKTRKSVENIPKKARKHDEIFFDENSVDILMKPMRARSRLGQACNKVKLDYSLCAYLEVFFLSPKMDFYVQDSLVKSRSWSRYLEKTVVVNGYVLDKKIELTLGISPEREHCGIFIYFRGRLIEAYKRVGDMIEQADICRGLLGVVDVTEIMGYSIGGSLLEGDKQGFLDSEEYSKLLEWLGVQTNIYMREKLNANPLVFAEVDASLEQEHVNLVGMPCGLYGSTDPRTARGFIRSTNPRHLVDGEPAGMGNFTVVLLEVFDSACPLWKPDRNPRKIGEVDLGASVVWPKDSVAVM